MGNFVPLVSVNGVAQPLPSGAFIIDAAGNTPVPSGVKITQRALVVTTSNIADLAAGAPLVVDGVTLTNGDAVLVTGQSTQTQNGLYTVSSAGTGSDGAWARHADMDSNTELNANVHVQVVDGTVYGDSLWALDATGGLTIGSSNILFVRVSRDRLRVQLEKEIFLDGQNNLSAVVVDLGIALRNGYLVGASVRASAARTAGTFAAEPHKNGTGLTPTGLDLLIDGTDTQQDRTTVASKTTGYDVTAGDRIGFILTTTSFAPGGAGTNTPNTLKLILEMEYDFS